MAHSSAHGPPHISGSVGGHVLPGVCFLLLGVHWTVAVVSHLVAGHRAEASRAWYPLPGTWTHAWPVEPALKAGLSMLGALVEVLIKDMRPGRVFFRPLFSPAGDFVNVNIWAHAAMYSFFALSGVVDFAMDCHVRTAAAAQAGAVASNAHARVLGPALEHDAADAESAAAAREQTKADRIAESRVGAAAHPTAARRVARRVELAALSVALAHCAIQFAFHASAPEAPRFFAAAHAVLVILLGFAALAAAIEAAVDEPEQAWLSALLRAVLMTTSGAWFVHLARYYREPHRWAAMPHGPHALTALAAFVLLAVLGTTAALAVACAVPSKAGLRVGARPPATARAWRVHGAAP
ncbi:hypothetical protein KFE25_001496 [Diacronema lutheri]|uniref:Uncharacterized protein n=1 Tax=Diacronema lutheri TaxID=2081491 RepID=A0A8J5X5D9_DIALT|nr:hypothetical protein KFE25_001496 [Diacronema lutheri]